MFELNTLNVRSNQLKQQWDDLASVHKIPSVLGLIPKYHCINKILSASVVNNAAVQCGLHEVDEESLGIFKNIILTVRSETHLPQLKEWIGCTDEFFEEEKGNKLKEEYNRV